MGAELGVAEFAMTIESVVPRWHPEIAQGPPGVFQEDDGGLDASMPDPPRAHFLSNSIGVPGMNHVVHNLSHDLDTRLQGWDLFFYPGLTNIAALLADDQRRKRVWACCVQDSPQFKHTERLWFQSVPKLYEKRWGYVIDFIAHAYPLITTLASTWSQEAYERGLKSTSGPGQASSQFDPAALTATLSSRKWLAYMDMILAIHSALHKLMA
eukprot:11498878-Alexandrium_andersonii.AAC.1